MSTGAKLIYKGKDVKVISEPKLCMGAGECGGSGLKAVFSKEAWITPDGAGVEQVVDIIERCPASSLRYMRLDGGPQEAPEVNTIQIAPDGALYIRGDIEIGGDNPATGMRYALCRCGHSENKPFCDGHHGKAEFKDEAQLAENPLSTKAENTLGKLTITPLPDGPLLVTGDFVLRNGTNTSRVYGNKIALCRCGASAGKPFCDGQHKAIDFKG